MALEINNFKQWKDQADKLLAERLEQIRNFENTEFVKKEELSRWQSDVSKLESSATGGYDTIKSLRDENQRLEL